MPISDRVYISQQPNVPFIVVAPQCPQDSIWTFQLDALNVLLDSVIAQHVVDAGHLYLTGLSLGGTGAWYLAIANPGRFAALAPICGRGLSWSLVHLLKDTPVWAFHGALDDIIPASESVRMVDTLKEIGCDARLTIYPDVGHDAWNPTYANPALYEWFLSHSLK